MMKSVLEYVGLLGAMVGDKITRIEGVVVSVSFDISGCVQAYIAPTAKDNVVPEGRWIDCKRIEVISRRMDCPAFTAAQGAEAGGQLLPAPRSGPG